MRFIQPLLIEQIKKEGMDRSKSILVTYQRDSKSSVLFIAVINLEFISLCLINLNKHFFTMNNR